MSSEKICLICAKEVEEEFYPNHVQVCKQRAKGNRSHVRYLETTKNYDKVLPLITEYIDKTGLLKANDKANAVLFAEYFEKVQAVIKST